MEGYENLIEQTYGSQKSEATRRCSDVLENYEEGDMVIFLPLFWPWARVFVSLPLRHTTSEGRYHH